MGRVGVLLAALACAVVSGCGSVGQALDDQATQSATPANASSVSRPATPGPETTGSIVAEVQGAGAAPADDANDDLALGKRHYRAQNFGLAERYFRRAVEKGPGDTRRDAEAWLGLAASYDRLRRFELADRAYAHAAKILGPTAEVLNNQGYSYLLRGDYVRAREKLAAAQELDPANPYIKSNLDLLAKSAR